MLEEVKKLEHEDGEPIFDQPSNEVGGDFDEEEGLTLVMRKTLLPPKFKSKEDWLRTNIFYTACSIGGRVCWMIIDGGSFENVVSQEAVDKLKLATQDHPYPYKLYWLKKGNEVKVTKHCLVPFSIQKKYFDEVWCDVVPMDVCHILLGRPWQFDHQMMHDGKKNTYILSKDNQQFNLLPTKENVTSKSSTTSLLASKNFIQESRHSGYILALIPVNTVVGIDVPSVVTGLLQQYGDVFPHELPPDLPPMRDIQHAINLVSRAPFQTNQHIVWLQRGRKSCKNKFKSFLIEAIFGLVLAFVQYPLS